MALSGGGGWSCFKVSARLGPSALRQPAPPRHRVRSHQSLRGDRHDRRERREDRNPRESERARDELVEVRDGVLIARVSAPALEGRANRALIRLLARRLGVAPSRVVIVRGERSREKLVRVHGISQSTLDAALRT